MEKAIRVADALITGLGRAREDSWRRCRCIGLISTKHTMPNRPLVAQRRRRDGEGIQVSKEIYARPIEAALPFLRGTHPRHELVGRGRWIRSKLGAELVA